jgi:precorrin-2/cobalt-factor-2 C20-methyltransferase
VPAVQRRHLWHDTRVSQYANETGGMPPGTLYGVGLGPGAPDLLTLRALQVIQRVPTLLLPVRRPGDSGLAYSIVEPHLEPGKQRIVRLPFPQAMASAELNAQWDEHCREVLALLQDGRDAAFLTEGDPLLYSSFIQLAERLRAHAPQLSVEIVPGVSAMNAAAAAAGQPLAARGQRLAVLPTVYRDDDLRQVLEEFDTVVLLKVNRSLDRLVVLLRELGLAERALLVERCGRPEQRIIRGLCKDPGPVDYFSLVIVRR